MATDVSRQTIRVFLSSPGDVPNERKLVSDVLGSLPYDPLLRGNVSIEIVAWDKAHAGTPLIASMSPQEAINKGMAKPSDCDIVVVIFWARMGTPLADDEVKPEPFRYPTATNWPAWRYFSGTEWEYIDAMQSALATGKPAVIVYRRTEPPMIKMDDPNFDLKREQWKLVNAFFDSFSNPDGSIRHSFNEYDTPEDLRTKFEKHIRLLVRDVLDERERAGRVDDAKPGQVIQSDWTGSPFPGLRAFTPADAPIFFGRGRETDALTEKLRNNRFVVVVGASGSGKSSLVGAGLIPRLWGNAISSETTGSKDWHVVTFKPGEVSQNPFDALEAAFLRAFPDLIGDRSIALTHESFAALRGDPAGLAKICATALANSPGWAEVFFFIDQFEELFTLVSDKSLRRDFISLITENAIDSRVRFIVTLRADFYHRCVEFPALAGLMRMGSFPLAGPEIDALFDMITRPAERAGLRFGQGLPGRILRDTGTEPGSLALLAYTLDELYHRRTSAGALTLTQYEALGGVQGAIGKRAEEIFSTLPPQVQQQLPRIFHELVTIDDGGTATRRRARVEDVIGNPECRQLVDALTENRLLVQDTQISGVFVEIAHEALLNSWDRLANLIADAYDDLRLLRQLKNAAYEWNYMDRPDNDYLWSQHRLKQVYEMQDRLDVRLDRIVEYFIRPETERLLKDFKGYTDKDYRQRTIVDRWVEIGEAAIPALIESIPYAGSEVLPTVNEALLQFGKRTVTPLVNCLKEAEAPDVRAHAALLLGELGLSGAVQALIPALQDDNTFVKAAAAVALRRFQVPASVEPLVTCLTTNEDADLRITLVETLRSQLGDKASARLAESLNSADTTARQQAILGLGDLEDITYVPKLIEMLDDSLSVVREAAAYSLGRLLDERSVAGLINALRMTDESVNKAAKVALSNFTGSEQVVPAMCASFADEPEEVQRRFVDVLGELGSLKALGTLAGLLESEHLALRRDATRAVGKLPGQQATRVLKQALNNDDTDVRVIAIEAMGTRDKVQNVTSDLLEALNDSEQKVRRAAVTALGSLGDIAALPALIEFLVETQDSSELKDGDTQSTWIYLEPARVAALRSLEALADSTGALELLAVIQAIIPETRAAALELLDSRLFKLQVLLRFFEQGQAVNKDALVRYLQGVSWDFNASAELSLTAATMLKSLGRESVIRVESYEFDGMVESGAVYKAFTIAGERVALKRGELSSIVQEEMILSNLDHPNIPRFIERVDWKNHHYIAMEYIDGKDLGAILENSTSPLPLGQIIDWGVSLCDILDYLHTHTPAILHRDVVPSNIMIDKSGTVYLVDFNIAEVYQAGKNYSMTGTEGYSSPEQYRGNTDPRSDLYSLAATLHHLVSRRDPRMEPPFTFQERPLLSVHPHVSTALDQAIMKALAFDPDERYVSAQAMKQALLDAVK